MQRPFDRVEYYAGGCGQEKPLAIYRGEERLLVKKIVSEKRLLDRTSGRRLEVFECLLVNGEIVKIEKELNPPHSEN